MKTTLALIILASFSTSALSATTMRIPLLADDGVSMKEANKRFKLTGANAFPEYITVSNNAVSYDKAYALVGKLSERMDALNEKYGTSFYVNNGTAPGEANLGSNVTCYTGDALGTLDIISGLTSTMFTEQLGFWGWKYKKTTSFDSDVLSSFDSQAELNTFLSDESNEWKNWKTTSDAVLLLYHYGDDGDDVGQVIIPKCQ